MVQHGFAFICDIVYFCLVIKVCGCVYLLKESMLISYC